MTRSELLEAARLWQEDAAEQAQRSRETRQDGYLTCSKGYQMRSALDYMMARHCYSEAMKVDATS